MYRLAILLLCIFQIAGCRFISKKVNGDKGYTYIVDSLLSDGSQTPYASDLEACINADTEPKLGSLSANKCALDVNDDKFALVLGVVPALGHRFSHWARADRGVHGGSRAPFIPLSTEGFNNFPILANILSEPQESFSARPIFKPMSSQELELEPAWVCAPGPLFAPGFSLEVTTRLEIPGRVLNIVSSEVTRSFELTSGRSADITRDVSFSFFDAASNRLASGDSTNRISYSKFMQIPPKNISSRFRVTGVTAHSVTTETIFIDDTKGYAVRDADPGFILPLSADLANSRFESGGAVMQYQGPDEDHELEEFEYSLVHTYDGWGSISLEGRPDATTCDFSIVEHLIGANGVSFTTERTERYLANDTVAGLLVWSETTFPDGHRESSRAEKVDIRGGFSGATALERLSFSW